MPKKLRDEIEGAEAQARERLSADQPQLIRWGTGLALFLAGSAVAAVALMTVQPPERLQGSDSGDGGSVVAASFAPPALADIPAGPEGDSIRRGMTIFNQTYADPEAMKYVGNGMACTNCHIDGGRRAGSAPMWAAWVNYPQFRKKIDGISTMTDRIKGCFMYSMNAQNSPAGEAPPENSNIYRDLELYFFWLAKGAATGTSMSGGGYPKLAAPAQPYDPKRGAAVYQQSCASCHGPDGQGASQPDGTVVYPALWGPHSYNWGAGMAMVNNAAAFIKANMPFDQAGTLSDQQAWDVAAYVDSQERPKDPRQTGTVAQNAAKHFAGAQTYYGKTVGGKLLGTGIAGSPFLKVPAIKAGAVTADPAVASLGSASPGS